MKIKGKVILYSLVAVLFCGVFLTPFTYADDTLSNLKDKLNNITSDKNDLQNQLNQGKKESSALSAEIQALEKKIYAAQSEINGLEKSLNTTKQEITTTLAELEKLEGEISQQNDELNSRLRTMYKNGEVGMLTVLLGSGSVSEMMTNMDMVERIYKADADLLASIQGQYAEVDAKKQKLQALKDTLEAQQADIEAKKTSLQNDKNDVSAKKKEVDADNKELAAQVDAINKEAAALTAQIQKLTNPNTPYAGGTMCWPSQASTRVTSPFGNRIHPILKVTKMHTGIDIGAAGGTNILAANSGTVITAGWNNSYGYMVMIDHGGGIVTLYAHSSKLLVSKGDFVARGQVIALVGSTGMSTGNHLHFEVRVNGVYKNPLDYVSTSVRK